MDVCVARQPIVDRKQRLFAYELLFRDSGTAHSASLNDDSATYTLLNNSYFVLGIKRTADEYPSFINFPQALLEQQTPLLFPPTTTVVEVLEDVEPTPKVIECCRVLKERGYRVALDDFVYKPELEPLIELADIIKVDILESSYRDVKAIAQRFRGNKILLAEKVETLDQYESAMSFGFDYFQGYFFSRPQLLFGREIPQLDSTSLELLAIVSEPDFQFDVLEQTLKQELSISHKLLRYIAFYLYKPEIDSLQQAITLLGQNEVRNFVTLMLLSNFTPQQYNLQLKIAAERAKFCESLAKLTGQPELEGQLFTLGMFSNIHGLLGNTPEEALALLPFSPNLKAALLDQSGSLGRYLKLALAFEAGEWSAVRTASIQLGLTEEALPTIYQQACQWADRVIR